MTTFTTPCAYCGQIDCQHQRHAEALLRVGPDGVETIRNQVVINDDEWLAALICRALQHPIAIRRGDFKTLTCICGAWERKIIEDPLPGPSGEVLIADLTARLEAKTVQYERLKQALGAIHEVIRPFLPHKDILGGVGAIDDIIHDYISLECQ